MSARCRVRHSLILSLVALLVAGSGISGFAPSLAAGTGLIYISGNGVHGIVRVDDMTGAGWTDSSGSRVGGAK